jgi:hypothetical protein
MIVGGKGAFDSQLVERQSRGERILIIALLAIGRQAMRTRWPLSNRAFTSASPAIWSS